MPLPIALETQIAQQCTLDLFLCSLLVYVTLQRQGCTAKIQRSRWQWCSIATVLEPPLPTHRNHGPQCYSKLFLGEGPLLTKQTWFHWSCPWHFPHYCISASLGKQGMDILFRRLGATFEARMWIWDIHLRKEYQTKRAKDGWECKFNETCLWPFQQLL